MKNFFDPTFPLTIRNKRRDSIKESRRNPVEARKNFQSTKGFEAFQENDLNGICYLLFTWRHFVFSYISLPPSVDLLTPRRVE